MVKFNALVIAFLLSASRDQKESDGDLIPSDSEKHWGREKFRKLDSPNRCGIGNLCCEPSLGECYLCSNHCQSGLYPTTPFSWGADDCNGKGGDACNLIVNPCNGSSGTIDCKILSGSFNVAKIVDQASGSQTVIGYPGEVFQSNRCCETGAYTCSLSYASGINWTS